MLFQGLLQESEVLFTHELLQILVSSEQAFDLCRRKPLVRCNRAGCGAAQLVNDSLRDRLALGAAAEELVDDESAETQQCRQGRKKTVRLHV
jgi:hypothetical protein